uniref:Uncharacterized protein n=1 Tax=Oryza meridionalis TaxID=40149 RepID=A0A0E0F3Y2_9ORYZ
MLQEDESSDEVFMRQMLRIISSRFNRSNPFISTM